MRTLILMLLLSACGTPGGDAPVERGTDLDRDGALADDDCDDGDPSIRPDATERCNGVDDDCDGQVDEVGATGGQTFYADADGDRYGDPDVTETRCAPEEGWVAIALDCDDGSALIGPLAEEVCNGVDDDCDGRTDLDDGDVVGRGTFVPDLDGDGYGRGDAQEVCGPADGSPPPGWTLPGPDTDCDDAAPATHPDAQEIPLSGADEDCDGLELCWLDRDGDDVGRSELTTSPLWSCDGVSVAVTDGDCDDDDPTSWPGAPEVCDRADNDCDGAVDADDPDVTNLQTWGPDLDLDGYFPPGVPTVSACFGPPGHASLAGDCDDGAYTVHPGADEVALDGLDQDCDGLELCYTDADDDSAGVEPLTASADLSCASPGVAVVEGDCDDLDPALGFPAVRWPDRDEDGAGADNQRTEFCGVVPDGWVEEDGDCDDFDPDRFFGNVEIVGNGVDDDCNPFTGP